jgi:integrase
VPKNQKIIFKDIAVEWVEKNYNSTNKRMSTLQTINQYMNKYIIPAIGMYKITDITKNIILEELISKVEDKPAASRRIISMISNILDLCIFKGIININVAKNIISYLPKARHKHVPAIIRSNEFQEFLKKLKIFPSSLPVIALNILIRVFVRPNELLKAEWDEINFKDKIWTIPASRMKSARTHIVPLSTQVISLFDQIPKINNKIFIGTKTSNNIDTNLLIRIITKLGYKSKASPHGFRATASTLLNQQGYNSDWIEQQLAHTSSGIRAVYNFADHLSERRVMMQAWSDYIDQLANDD